MGEYNWHLRWTKDGPGRMSALVGNDKIVIERLGERNWRASTERTYTRVAGGRRGGKTTVVAVAASSNCFNTQSRAAEWLLEQVVPSGAKTCRHHFARIPGNEVAP
jgi:hypothetical protein